MNYITTTLICTLTLLLFGCQKTKQTETLSSTQQANVDVEFEHGEIVLMIDGEEQIISLDEIMRGEGLEDIDGEVMVSVMAFGDSEGKVPGGPHGQIDGDFEVDMQVIVNGEEVDLPTSEMMGHVMHMIGGKGMHGGHPSGHPNRYEMMDRHHPEHEHGEWRMHEREVSEEHQFMKELAVLNDVSHHLRENEGVALLGIHMIRDNLEDELLLDALNEIIEESLLGSPVRNAAIIVAIQAMQEFGDIEGAADLMVELVLSNE